MFWISLALIVLFVVMAIFPQLFTSKDPTFADLSKSREAALGRGRVRPRHPGIRRVRANCLRRPGLDPRWHPGHIVQPRSSGPLVGIIAGYRGGWVDSVIGRIAEIFLAIPLLLGGILFLYTFPNDPMRLLPVQLSKVALVIAILAWPTITRLMRSSVLQVKPNDYVQAARALGASPWRIISSHILPNSVASVIVVSTINLGVFIAAEASLSFLGVGLQPPVISWGNLISEASGIGLIRAAPHMLLFPSLFLSLTVLSFIMLGDVVRDALDPRLR